MLVAISRAGCPSSGRRDWRRRAGVKPYALRVAGVRHLLRGLEYVSRSIALGNGSAGIDMRCLGVIYVRCGRGEVGTPEVAPAEGDHGRACSSALGWHGGRCDRRWRRGGGRTGYRDGDQHGSQGCRDQLTWPFAGPKAFEIAVAFSHREDASVRWVTVGERCTKCGVLGAAVDWKIDYPPTEHLYDQV